MGLLTKAGTQDGRKFSLRTGFLLAGDGGKFRSKTTHSHVAQNRS